MEFYCRQIPIGHRTLSFLWIALFYVDLWNVSRGNWLAGQGSWGIGVFVFKGYGVVMVIA